MWSRKRKGLVSFAVMWSTHDPGWNVLKRVIKGWSG